jgi:ATP-dependent Clp protease ATP-binding subunit ClpC
MFDHYDEAARRVIYYALHIANHYGAKSIEPEHILLGLLKEEPQFIRYVADLKEFSIESMLHEIGEPAKAGNPAATILPLSRNSQSVLKLTAQAAREREHSQIGIAHLLIGLSRHPESLAGKILRQHGFSAELIMAWYE